MAENARHRRPAGKAEGEQDPLTANLDEPVPTPNDPGGAHAKGYAAEAGPAPAVADSGALPLVSGPDQPAVRVPERDKGVQPTGRSEPGESTPRDRVRGVEG